jgi:hypothetical protein
MNKKKHSSHDYPWLGQGRYNREGMKDDYREINFFVWLAIAWIVITLATGIYIETL